MSAHALTPTEMMIEFLKVSVALFLTGVILCLYVVDISTALVVMSEYQDAAPPRVTTTRREAGIRNCD